MKSLILMMIKCCLFLCVFFCLCVHISSEKASELKDVFFIHLIDDELSMQKIRNALTSYQIEEIERKWNEAVEVPVISQMKKKIYLYNTHQSEEYLDGITIFEVTYQLAVMLKEAGFDVIFETSDFLQEMTNQNLKYHQLYTVSRQHLNDALADEGPFDLIIDVHRDSTKRSVSIVEHEGNVYGRLMFVIGNKSINAKQVAAHSHALTDKMNQRLSGIMREPFIRESVYNQDMAENMLLLEVGSDQNTSSEVLRSLEVFVDMLKKEGFNETIYD